jgi:hypothetical protein
VRLKNDKRQRTKCTNRPFTGNKGRAFEKMICALYGASVADKSNFREQFENGKNRRNILNELPIYQLHSNSNNDFCCFLSVITLL